MLLSLQSDDEEGSAPFAHAPHSEGGIEVEEDEMFQEIVLDAVDVDLEEDRDDKGEVWTARATYLWKRAVPPPQPPRAKHPRYSLALHPVNLMLPPTRAAASVS